MNRPPRLDGSTAAGIAGALAALACSLALAQPVPQPAPQPVPQLTPPAQRLSDEAIDADQQRFADLQQRIRAHNAQGRRLGDYHLAKAQCWLDAGFHEYSRNDRGEFPQAALAQSHELLNAMAAGTAPLPMTTPLVAGALRIRPDLWSRAQALATRAGASCAAAKAACAEVELVHAGHEQAQLGWRHARPYVQIAEDLLADGEHAAQSCIAAAAPQLAVRPQEELLLTLPIVFAFDRHDAAAIRPASSAQLDALLARLRAERWHIVELSLDGHADRLNRSRDAGYNEQLSQRRVHTVRERLLALGADAAAVTTHAWGDTQPLEACRAADLHGAALQECLLPNRRVDLRLRAQRAAR